MLHIYVHARFENLNEEKKRDLVYDCLQKKGWKKITPHHISTSWYGTMNTANYNEAFETARDHFKECATLQKANVTLVVQVGPQIYRQY